MSEEFPRLLDPSILSDEVRKLEAALLKRIIGQDRAVKQFTKVYQQLSVGLNKPNRPVATFLFTGPTGTGKTELVRCAAEYILGSKENLTRIDCGEYQHSHEVAKLIGSPPGYIGHGDERNIRLSQDKIDQYQKPNCKINFLLFDEIEEAHDTLLSAILQILDAGRLTLGNGKETDFSRTIVVLTSNLGEREAQRAITKTQLGLAPPAVNKEETDEAVYRVSKAAATKHFKAKFINRVDRIIVFRPLSEESLRKILDIELDYLQDRIFRSAFRMWESRGDKDETPPTPFRPLIKYTAASKKFILAEGTDKKYGARELNRAVDRFVAFPLGALMGSKQIIHGDIVEADYKEGDKVLTFRVTEHRDIKPIPSPYSGKPQLSAPDAVDLGDIDKTPIHDLNPYRPNIFLPGERPAKPAGYTPEKKEMPPRKPWKW